MSTAAAPIAGKRRENALLALFRIRVFRRMWAAITFSSLGDWLGLLANTALAQQLTHTSSHQVQGAAISGVILVRLAPDLLFGPFAAALADKLDRRKTVIIGEFTAGILYASIAIGYNLVWLYVAQFVIEAVGLFTQPAKQVVWLAVIPKKFLSTASQLSLISVYGTVPVASVVFALLSVINRLATGNDAVSPHDVNAAIVVALLLNTVSFFVSASTVFISRHDIPARPAERERSQSIFSLLREGVSFVWRDPLIHALYVGIIGAFAAGGLIVGVAQLWVDTLSAGTAGYAVMFGTVFTGLAVGMLIGPRLLPSLTRSRVFGLTIGGVGFSMLAMSLVDDFILAVVLAAFGGFFAGMAWVTGYTMIGQEVEDRLRGRIFAFVLSSVRLTLLATIAIGANVAGLLGSHRLTIGKYAHLRFSGPSLTLLIGGFLALLVSWYATSRATPTRNRLRDIVRRRLVRAGAGAPADHTGLFVSVDGIDRAATARYAELIVQLVSARQIVVTTTAEPTDSPTGRRVGELLFEPGHGDIEPETAALLAAADRSEHVASVIRPALERSEVVVCDRYLLTTMALHGALGADVEHIRGVNDWSTGGLRPDIGVVVDDEAAPANVRQTLLDEADADPDRYLVCPASAHVLPQHVLDRLTRLLEARTSLIAAVPATR